MQYCELALKKFHQYLYGRCFFSLCTDHKPLLSILSPKKNIPSLAAACLQRWAILLSAYTYIIVYKSSKDHGNADALSQLPLPNTDSAISSTVPTLFNIGQIEALPVTCDKIEQVTQRDPILSNGCTVH